MIIGALLILAMLMTPASAADFYANQAIGNDANDCKTVATPCLTLGAIVKRLPLVNPDGTIAGNIVNMAAGSNFREVFDVSHGPRVMLRGPLAPDGSCPDATLARVDSVWAQDGAVVWNACFTTGSISCRQFAIIDSREIVFDGSLPIAYNANERCKINTSGRLWVTKSLIIFAAVHDSTFLQAGDLWLAPNLTMLFLYRAAVHGTLDLSAATYSGSPLLSGQRTWCDHCDITYPVPAGVDVLPGNGSGGSNFTSNASR